MSDLRNKYKATSTQALKGQIQEEDTLVGSDGRAGFLSIDDGTNKFRIYPAHNPETGSFYVLVLKHWMTTEGDDGKEKRTTVLNAKQHGGFKKDPFEEYIKGASDWLNANEDNDAAGKISTMTDWKTGLTASPGWLLYANKVKTVNGEVKKEFGLLEFGKSVRDGLNKIATFEEEGEPIQFDPFTDCDDGLPVLITYTPKAKNAKDKYSVTTGTKPKAMPLTDEELQEFESVKPLDQLNRNYGVDDLKKAIEGIQFFDSKYEVGYCETDEWQEKVDELTEMISKGKGKAAAKPAPAAKKPAVPSKPAVVTKKPAAPVVEEEAEEEEEEEAPKKPAPAPKKKGDQFDSMDREALTQFWADNDLAETAAEHGVKLLKVDTEEERRKKVRQVYNAKLAATTEEEEEEVAEEEEEEAPVAKKPAAKPAVVAKKPAVVAEEEEEDDDLSLKSIKDKIKKSTGQ